MKNNETGEYELVVGNPQLLSGFFIVVLLFGVAFAMGYVVGQNSPRSAKTQADTAAPVSPQVTTDTRSPAAPAVPASPPAADRQAEANPAQPPTGTTDKPVEAPPQPTTQPAREVSSAPAVPAPVQAQPAAPPGSYWQVGAFRLASEAQPTLQMLRDGGMPASLQTGPDNLVHLVVGPYADRVELSKARSDLERLGIKTMIRK
jgi:cell division septation protein DedD